MGVVTKKLNAPYPIKMKEPMTMMMVCRVSV